MTCIVGLVHEGDVYMGADSAWGTYYRHELIKEGKLFKNSGYLFGCAGSARQAQVLKYAFKPPHCNNGGRGVHRFMVTDFTDAVRKCLRESGVLKKKDEFETTDGMALVATNGALFYLGMNLQMTESLDEYMAIGCGQEWALGSLHSTVGRPPKERLKLALAAAAKFSSGVRPPFSVKVLHGS